MEIYKIVKSREDNFNIFSKYLLFIASVKCTRVLYRVLLIYISITQCNELCYVCNMQHITICMQSISKIYKCVFLKTWEKVFA